MTSENRANDIPQELTERLRALKVPTLRVVRVTREVLTEDGDGFREPARVEWTVYVPRQDSLGTKVHSIRDLRLEVRRQLEILIGEYIACARRERGTAQTFPSYRAACIANAERHERDADALLAVSREFHSLWPEGT